MLKTLGGIILGVFGVAAAALLWVYLDLTYTTIRIENASDQDFDRVVVAGAATNARIEFWEGSLGPCASKTIRKRIRIEGTIEVTVGAGAQAVVSDCCYLTHDGADYRVRIGSDGRISGWDLVMLGRSYD